MENQIYSKRVLLTIFIAFLSLAFFSGCEKSAEKKQTANIDADSTIEYTPFEKAKNLKKDHYNYSEIMKELRTIFPDKKELLSEIEKKELFPEMMIGESFPCSGINTAYYYWNDGKLEDRSGESTDKISIKINTNDTLSFLTATSVEFGSTEGVKFEIIKNNDSLLLAQQVDSNGADTIMVNKYNGIGFWQSSLNGPIRGQMISLQCFLPD